MGAFYLWHNRLPRPFGPRNDSGISDTLCLSAFVVENQFEKTKPIYGSANERKVFLEKRLRQKATCRSRKKQSQSKPISVPATRFIVYNPLDDGCRILDARRVSRNSESRIENRDYD
jgi:hypothetical protein